MRLHTSALLKKTQQHFPEERLRQLFLLQYGDFYKDLVKGLFINSFIFLLLFLGHSDNKVNLDSDPLGGFPDLPKPSWIPRYFNLHIQGYLKEISPQSSM